MLATVLCAEFIALSSASDANRKRIARTVTRDRESCCTRVRACVRASGISFVRNTRIGGLLPTTSAATDRVYFSNTVSAVRKRVCLSPSHLRVSGFAKDAVLVSLELLDLLESQVSRLFFIFDRTSMRCRKMIPIVYNNERFIPISQHNSSQCIKLRN